MSSACVHNDNNYVLASIMRISCSVANFVFYSDQNLNKNFQIDDFSNLVKFWGIKVPFFKLFDFIISQILIFADFLEGKICNFTWNQFRQVSKSVILTILEVVISLFEAILVILQRLKCSEDRMIKSLWNGQNGHFWDSKCAKIDFT